MHLGISGRKALFAIRGLKPYGHVYARLSLMYKEKVFAPVYGKGSSDVRLIPRGPSNPKSSLVRALGRLQE